MPRGINLNNPMNLERNSISWQGASTLQDDPRFVRFETPEMGVRAGMKVLLTYQNKDDLQNISAIITKYAPPAENDTAAYISDVSAHCGVSPTDFFDVEVPDNMIRLAQAIIIHEQGHCPDDSTPFWYENDVYESAAKDALG